MVVRLMFEGFDSNGEYTLWSSNGSASGAAELTVPTEGEGGFNPNDNYIALPSLTDLNGKYYFGGLDSNGSGGLWVTGGTAAGTREIYSGIPGGPGVAPGDITAYDGDLYFSGYDQDPSALVSYNNLWESNGTAAGTREIFSTGGAGGMLPNDLTVYDGDLYFNGQDNNSIQQLWVWNGETASTIGQNIYSDLNPQDLTVYNGSLYFNGVDTAGHSNMFEWNGSVLSVVSFSGMSANGLNPQNLFTFTGGGILAGNWLLFNGTDSNGAQGLWYDDNNNGKVFSGEFTAMSGSYSFNPADFVLLNGNIFYSATNSSGNRELYEFTLGATQTQITSGVPTGDFNPQDLTVYNGELYFSAFNASNVQGLWESNGTSVSQVIAGSTANGDDGLTPTGLTTVYIPTTKDDFLGGGLSDILLQNSNSQPAIWLMNGLTLKSGTALTNPGAGWNILGTGDFNGDGKADILFQQPNGTPTIWIMNGTTTQSVDNLPNPGGAWRFAGSGDFNGDGTSDLLWQDTANGQLAIWTMNNGALGTGTLIGAVPGSSWNAIATGDFNGDGLADIALQNVDGTPAIWLMNGAAGIESAAALPNPGPSWREVGTGDFNGDGLSDLLWQNTNGEIAIWEMNGLSIASAQVLGADPGPSWVAKGAADYNGDGMSDILLQNTNGQVAMWEMNGFNIIGSVALSGNPGAAWSVIGG